MPEGLEKSNYLGSKRRLAKYIVDRFPDGAKTVADPMCGVSAVLIEAARRGMRIKGNDLSIVPYWYSKGVFEGAPLSDADVNKLLGASSHDGWLTTEWKGQYPRPRAVRRYLDGLARRARSWSGPTGLTAKAAVSAVLQTLYSESGSGYSTRRYEDVEKVRAVVRRAAKEVSKLAGEVGGKGAITNVDAKAFSFPRADVVYFDPPYFKRDKGAVHYFQSYRIMNSVLLGREWKEKNLSPDDIPPILQKLCRSARHVFVSTSSNEVVPYAKEIARHKRTMKRFRVSYRQTSGFGSRDEEQHQNLYAAKAVDSGSTKDERAGRPEDAKAAERKFPPEDGTYRYVIQHHFRGRSVHADLRIETGSGSLAGWTLGTQLAGSIPKPVATVEEALALNGYSKVDWEAGRVLDPVAAERKADGEPSWLDFEGVIEPGETGALAEHPGVVVIVDRGVCEYGARREGYEELFLTSDHPSGGMTGRVVFTKLSGSHKVIWLFSLPDDDMPNVLTARAVKDGWVPPQQYSALPRSLREDVPEERRYWLHAEAEKRLEIRDALVAALGSGELELSGLRKDAGETSQDDFEKRKLTPFNQWGSSAKYAKRLVEKLPEHTRYVEPFCGAAAVLFAKERADEEVLADMDTEVVFALKYIKRLTPPRFEALKRFNWTVSRSGFKRARDCKPESEHARFWKIVYRRLCAWGGIPWSTGFSTIHDGQTYPLDGLWRFHERLKGVRIVRQDWKETLRACDGKDTLFFIDPPYIKEWGKGGGIPPEEIAAEVKRLKGRFVIAYTDSAQARRALAKVGKLFTMRMLEARHRGLWAKRSRLFASSFGIGKSLGEDDLSSSDIEEDIRKSVPPDLPVPFECAVDITKSYEEDGTWIVEGYAATSDFDLQEDIITEEAILASAKDLIENSTVLRPYPPVRPVPHAPRSAAVPQLAPSHPSARLLPCPHGDIPLGHVLRRQSRHHWEILTPGGWNAADTGRPSLACKRRSMYSPIGQRAGDPMGSEYAENGQLTW
ncbi:MAG: DNA adenine methylase [Planctomycetota bacterium]|jgi:DNA adenine methylase